MKILQGIDLLKVERIKKIYLNYKDKFLKKILTDLEIEQIKKNQRLYYKIAGKFSAKEAVVKAMGTGFSDGIKLKDIEIINLKNGKPIINFYGKAKKIIGNIESSSISISNDGGFVISVATFIIKKI
jgi:holo-[acyl-carrier protein] synthase